MKYKVGDLVWLASVFEGAVHEGQTALIISAYISQPKIILNDKKNNKLWLEDEDVGDGWVYDILFEGSIDESILAEWLLPIK